jgi:hypothetical protein
MFYFMAAAFVLALVQWLRTREGFWLAATFQFLSFAGAQLFPAETGSLVGRVFEYAAAVFGIVMVIQAHRLVIRLRKAAQEASAQ